MPRGRKKQAPESPAPEIIDIAPGEEMELPEEIKPQNSPRKVKFECGFAPPGKSAVAVDHSYGGKIYKYQLELENKIFVLPDDLSEPIRQYTQTMQTKTPLTLQLGLFFWIITKSPLWMKMATK